MQVLNFYSTIFADQLKRGRKTATIRLGDKSHKYKKNQAVLVTIGYQHSPREKIFDAVIDQVEVKRVRDLTPRDIEHDNPEFRRHEEMIHFLEQIYGKKVTMDDIVTVVRFSQIIEHPPSDTDARLGIGGAQNQPGAGRGAWRRRACSACSSRTTPSGSGRWPPRGWRATRTSTSSGRPGPPPRRSPRSASRGPTSCSWTGCSRSPRTPRRCCRTCAPSCRTRRSCSSPACR